MAEVLAALDLGTSRIRIGVLDGAALAILGDAPNTVVHGAGGSARCRFSDQWRTVQSHLAALGAWCTARGVTAVRLAVTGQVSSLLRWDQAADAPVEDEYAIWMDATCADAVPAMTARFAHGRDVDLVGTCLPPATNWLAAKAWRHHRDHAEDASLVLQLQDAVVRRLTGALVTHPSAQISLVDHRLGAYSPELLAFAGLDEQRLPRLAPHASSAMLPEVAGAAGMPPSAVHVAPQDTYASLFGLCPDDGDGLLLAGTSEIVGCFERAPRGSPPRRLISARLGDGWIQYGSSSSGGATIDWLMRSVLRRSDAADLVALTRAAEEVPPGCDGLVCLPYLAGERAPLWNAQLSGSFIGLRPHHGDAHMLRAALEGVAFARRQAAEAIERELPRRFLAAGGGTANALWNRIRASVLDRPLAVLEQPDVALIGAMRWACAAAGIPDAPVRALARSREVPAVAAWTPVYAAGYRRFLALQRAALDASADDAATAQRRIARA